MNMMPMNMLCAVCCIHIHVFVFHDSAFMMALQESPEYRLFALPPIYNFRRATLHARNGPALPVMLHAHTFANKKANLSNYHEVAKHAALLIFDDCYQRMRLRSGPYPFVCDMLVV